MGGLEVALLFYSDDDDADRWRRALQAQIPDLDFRSHPDVGDPAEIEAALVWKPPRDLLRQFPNLKVILSLAAGVDALLLDDTLPKVPICRMVDPSLAFGMAEFVLATTLFLHRDLHRFADQQRHRRWNLILPEPPANRRVGILGLGEMGLAAGTMLSRHGFSVRGWSRSPKAIDGITCFSGPEGLYEMASDCDIIVCILPLTAETTGLLDSRLFDVMPRGTSLIHVGRGPQLDENHLLAALESGQVGYAVLDVFINEPLPDSHAFWTHPKIMVTPHAASYSTPESGAVSVAENIRRMQDGLPLLYVVDRERGY
jgi:glyoxylate/hydroxypyruvate reductase A